MELKYIISFFLSFGIMAYTHYLSDEDKDYALGAIGGSLAITIIFVILGGYV
jgi:hypothetical protein